MQAARSPPGYDADGVLGRPSLTQLARDPVQWRARDQGQWRALSLSFVNCKPGAAEPQGEGRRRQPDPRALCRAISARELQLGREWQGPATSKARPGSPKAGEAQKVALAIPAFSTARDISDHPKSTAEALEWLTHRHASCGRPVSRAPTLQVHLEGAEVSAMHDRLHYLRTCPCMAPSPAQAE